MFLMILAAACTPESTDTGKEENTTPQALFSLTAPATVDFGDGAVDTTSTATLTLTNDGEELATLTTAKSSDGDVPTDSFGPVMIAAGASQDLTLAWTPSAVNDLNGSLDLYFQGDDGQTQDVLVRLAGHVQAGVLDHDLDSVEFGTIDVGCPTTKDLTVSNTGDADLTITGIGFVDVTDVLTVTADGAELSLPWTLVPGETRTFQVTYAPEDESTTGTLLEIDSDDPTHGATQLSVDGTGHIDGAETVSYTVNREYATAVFGLNAVAVFSGNFGDAIWAFFDQMLTYHTKFRVVLLTEMNGEVVGDTPYIDETYTADDALTTATGMLANTGGDNDYLLDTFENAIPANLDWLIEDDDDWADATLNLIAMNSDQEQSVGSYKDYVETYQTYKTDPSKVFVGAISGPTPSGCNTGGKFAEPADALVNASAESGGLFYSWCDDWEEGMREQADETMRDQVRFVLDNNPADWSIHVFVDEVEQDEGWTYDADNTQVVFDDDHYPSNGSEVRIDYYTTPDCL